MVAESQSFALGFESTTAQRKENITVKPPVMHDRLVAPCITMNPGKTFAELMLALGTFPEELRSALRRLVADRIIEQRADGRFYHRPRRKWRPTWRERFAAWLLAA